MTRHSNKQNSILKGFNAKSPGATSRSQSRIRPLLTNIHTLVPLLSGILLILCGLTLVSITILGFITPLWISAVLSLIGSISSMVGLYLIYQTVSSAGSFETLINESIRRVINSQN